MPLNNEQVLAALRTVDGLEIRGQRPGRRRIRCVVLLQVQIEREAEAALGEAARAAMAGRATLGKQFWRGLALIEILRASC